MGGKFQEFPAMAFTSLKIMFLGLLLAFGICRADVAPRYGRREGARTPKPYYASQETSCFDCVWLVAACTLVANFFRRTSNVDADKQLHDRLRDPSSSGEKAKELPPYLRAIKEK